MYVKLIYILDILILTQILGLQSHEPFEEEGEVCHHHHLLGRDASRISPQ